ncbi:Hypothetical protein CINCED_3A017087 [Cinara cedri]|uniref:Uncharacterized protein n=1 Tax=Cinara cedri TaxID=506608 RepID=A0A5E4N146_9HEMI|nr:Hypothetical protein CINCED_3A017087 [Cinara cedri]
MPGGSSSDGGGSGNGAGGSGHKNSQQHRLEATMTMLRRRSRNNRGRLVRWERVSEWTGTTHVTAWDVIVRDSLLHIAWPMSLGAEPVGPPLDQLYITGLLKSTLNKLNTNMSDNKIYVFRATGFSPFEPQKVIDKLPKKYQR